MTQPRNVISALIGLAVFAACLVRFPTPLGQMREAMRLLFEVGVGVVFVGLLWFYCNRWLSAFLALAMVSMFFPKFGQLSYFAYNAVFYGLLFVVAVKFFGSMDFVLDVLLIVVCVNLSFLFLQYFDVLNLTSTALPTGLMANPNETSALMAFCIPACLRPGRYLYLLPVFLGLILAKSFGGVLAGGIGLLAWFCLSSRGFMLKMFACGLLMVCALIFIWIVDAPSVASRWDAWMQGVEVYKHHWLMGYGIGHWAPLFLRFEIHGNWFSYAHNEFLQMLVEMGLGSAVILCGYYFSIFRRFSKKMIIPFIGIVIVSINSLVNFPLHIAPTAMILLLYIGFFEQKAAV